MTDDTTLIVPSTLPTFDLVAAIADQAATRHALTTYHEGLAAETLRRQQADLALFASFLHATTGIEAGDFFTDLSAWQPVTYGLLDAWKRWQLAQGYALGSVNVRLATAKAYCKLAHDAGLLSTEAYVRIQGVKGYKGKQAHHVDEKREVTRIGSKKERWLSVSPAHAALLKREAGGDSPLATRDLLLVCLLVDHGLRIGEAASLCIADIDLDTGQFTFYRQKVHKTQTHDMEPDTLRAAMRYLPGLPVEQTLLFDGISTRQLRARIQLLGKRAGIEHLAPHDLRHAWATDAARNGTDLKALQDAGGWASPAMPLHYIESAKIANAGVKLSRR